ncbi:DUF418 domain-containing protein [Rathayibacter iranicus]|uniref:DUF418 domain-containing protein n=1 Tax=Rathayibacter iranicus TaxID=59737 RepID=A0AAD1AG79_9MICO|nr:DUF418 domain-containing protein [Rathayibacter iranicus]AZZ56004.1 DUF418 domain-containing protein [Rathayibacter iranicus]MWV30311.1 DUF418 domain-containing protein [Rathayibacter iranicus NCPPB 2253 = VKM Ac-1602]PPI46466.1 hypothetical protein C5E09_08020 [Rathayibacter iranicus]PPI59881.1 hypothetical protein C5E08_08950 [Rathayibacter iranicus]PPI71545.1 hypothetical protein C5E01_07985 [Rathayibacter iranicus]
MAAARDSRLPGLDVARGLAVLGMLAAHLAPIGREMLWDGRSAVLFAVLAGVSIGLMTGGAGRSAEPWRDTASILLRALLVLTLGLALTLLRTPIAVILPHYGLMFAVTALLLFLPRVVLAVLVALIAIVGPLLVDELTISGNRWLAMLPPQESVLAALPVTWLTQYYPVPSWLAYVVLGLLIARCNIRSDTTARWLAIGGAAAVVLGYGGGLILGGPEAVEAHASTTPELVGAGGFAAVVLGASMALTERLPLLRRVTAPLAAVGAMPLTIYSVQLVALAVYLVPYEPFDFEAWRSWPLVTAFVLGSVSFALGWRRLVGQGPLEWLIARASLRPRRPLVRPALG